MVMKANQEQVTQAVKRASKAPMELAWAAGFFDGEGCISLANRKTKPSLRVSVCQMDRRPLDRFHKALGGLGVVWEPKPGMVSKACYWKTTTDQAMAVLSLLWCYLSEPKREQTLRILNEMNYQGTIQVLLSLTR